MSTYAIECCRCGKPIVTTELEVKCPRCGLLIRLEWQWEGLVAQEGAKQ